MDLDCLKEKQTGRITEWVTGGPYAVAVEVEIVIFPDRLGEPYLTPETARYLEKLAQLAEAGDVEALQQAGTVYVKLDESVAKACAGGSDKQKG
jgi:hypothetical protein